MNKKIHILIVLAIAFITAGIGCRTGSGVRDFPNVTLEYWGVFESAADIQKLTAPYSARHPKISIRYRNFREDEYKQKMVEAWALGQGPDLFMIPATKIREFQKFITPMPASMDAPVEYEKGTIKKEIITEIKTYSGYTTKQIRDTFLDTIFNDIIINNQIYGLPFSVDMFAVYYNRDILKNNNIALAATNWQELISQASQISKLDSDGKLVESTIALGTTNNIPNAIDIISTLMMQVGIEMGNAAGPQFQNNEESLNAIQFYSSFAQEGLQNYSWNSDMINALDSFTAGKTAYFIGYPYHARLIRDANPKIDWDVIPMFKPSNTDIIPTYTNYWVTVVANPQKSSDLEKTKAELAWQFLSETTKAQNVRAFLNNPNNRRTTALKALIEEQQKDPVIGPFAQNLLNAKTWYRGYNFDLAEKYFLEMVDTVNSTETVDGADANPQLSINAGSARILQTYTPN